MHSRSSLQRGRSKGEEEDSTYQEEMQGLAGQPGQGRPREHSLPASVAQSAGIHFPHVAHADDANALVAMMHGCLCMDPLHSQVQERSQEFRPWRESRGAEAGRKKKDFGLKSKRSSSAALKGIPGGDQR